MSPRAAAPSRASMIACVRTSASECPARPLACGMSTPPRISRRPGENACVSTPIPVRTVMPAAPRCAGSLRRLHGALAHAGGATVRPPSSQRLEPPRPALEDADLLDARRFERGHRVLVAVPELVRRMRVARQGDGEPGVDGHLEQRPGRVQLGGRLAETGGPPLPPGAGVEERPPPPAPGA